MRFVRSRCAKHSQHAVLPGRKFGPIQSVIPSGLTSSQGRPDFSAAELLEIVVRQYDRKVAILVYLDIQRSQRRGERFDWHSAKLGKL